MATSSTKALLKAVEGFSGANAGNPDHESTIALLQRVKAEIAKGKGPAPDSPGRREALGASQRNFPAELNHQGSAGNARSNNPGSVRPHDESPSPWRDSNAGERRLSGTEAVKTDGHLTSNHPSSFPAPATPQYAIRGGEGEKAQFSLGGPKSNRPGPPARSSGRMGDVEIRKAVTPEGPTTLAGAGQHDMGEGPLPTGNPPPMGGNVFERAAQQAKARLKASRK